MKEPRIPANATRQESMGVVETYQKLYRTLNLKRLRHYRKLVRVQEAHRKLVKYVKKVRPKLVKMKKAEQFQRFRMMAIKFLGEGSYE